MDGSSSPNQKKQELRRLFCDIQNQIKNASKKAIESMTTYGVKIEEFCLEKNPPDFNASNITTRLALLSKSVEETEKSLLAIIEGLYPYLEAEDPQKEVQFAALLTHIEEVGYPKLESAFEESIEELMNSFYLIRKDVNDGLQTHLDELLPTLRKGRYHIDFMACSLRQWSICWNSLQEDELSYLSSLLVKMARMCVLCRVYNIDKKYHRCRPGKFRFMNFAEKLEEGASSSEESTGAVCNSSYREDDDDDDAGGNSSSSSEACLSQAN